MRQREIIFLFMLCLIVSAFNIWATPPEIFPLKDIKVGMKGYGLTVFKGTEISRFEAEILGVLRGFFPQQDIILARLSAPELKDIGVIAGMSGSPVFIEDKIIGAVAYGWSFSKEPICGITPIENMLTVLQLAEEQKNLPVSVRGASGTNKGIFATHPRLTLSREQLTGTPLLEILKENFVIELEPLSTPLCISNCDPRLLPWIKNRLARYPFLPVISGQATPGVNLPGQKVKLEPGSALGVQLMSGDMDISAIGTVTYTRDDKVLAFGHSMFQSGNIKIPMATAFIFSIMPNVARPFKLGGVIEPVGALRQDRLPAVAGFLDEVAPMVPLKIKVNIPSQKLEQAYNYQIWEDKEFAPLLTAVGIMESISAAYKSEGENSAAMHYKISLNDGTILEKEEFMSNPSSPDPDLYFTIEYDLMNLLTNPFKEVRLQNIEYAVRLIDKTQLAYIITARTDKEEYKPGETVKVTVWLQPYREPKQKITIEIKLPSELKENEYSLLILDGTSRQRLEYSKAPGTQAVYNFQQLVRNLGRFYPANYLYFVLQYEAAGVTVEGEELPELPISVRSTISNSAAPGMVLETSATFIAEEKIPTDYSISGKQIVKIAVRNIKSLD